MPTPEPILTDMITRKIEMIDGKINELVALAASNNATLRGVEQTILGVQAELSSLRARYHDHFNKFHEMLNDDDERMSATNERLDQINLKAHDRIADVDRQVNQRIADLERETTARVVQVDKQLGGVDKDVKFIYRTVAVAGSIFVLIIGWASSSFETIIHFFSK